MNTIKGDTLEAQMKHVDVILGRMSRKTHKTTTAITTPFPISGYAQDPIDKVVLRYMFPADGKITVGGMFVEDMPKDGVDVFVNIHRGDSVISESLFTKSKVTLIKPNVDILAKDRLVVSVVPKGGGSVSKIWVSFLWVLEVKDSVIKQFLIEDLERIGEEDGETG